MNGSDPVVAARCLSLKHRTYLSSVFYWTENRKENEW